MESSWNFVDAIFWLKFLDEFWWEMSWKVGWMICMSSVESLLDDLHEFCGKF